MGLGVQSPRSGSGSARPWASGAACYSLPAESLPPEPEVFTRILAEALTRFRCSPHSAEFEVQAFALQKAADDLEQVAGLWVALGAEHAHEAFG